MWSVAFTTNGSASEYIRLHPGKG